jgi:hypothetical protein
MANGAIVISQQQAGEFLDILDSLEKSLAKLRLSLQMYLPSQYGSDSWWEKSDAKAIDSIRHGRGKRFTALKQAVNYLHS